MSRKYLNDRWCVRCGKRDPTPYLRECFYRSRIRPRVGEVAVDIGCGNGRNSRYLRTMGYDVYACDMAPNAGGIPLMLGHDRLPGRKGNVRVILANYVLMFLNKRERLQVYAEIDAVAKHGTKLVVELYAARDSHAKTPRSLRALQNEVMWWFVANSWTVVHNKTSHFVLEKK